MEFMPLSGPNSTLVSFLFEYTRECKGGERECVMEYTQHSSLQPPSLTSPRAPHDRVRDLCEILPSVLGFRV